MNRIGTKGLAVCLATALGLTVLWSSSLRGQIGGIGDPDRSETEYFVTGEGDSAHLWIREGSALRCIGHGKCKTQGDKHDDHKHDGHDHGKDKDKDKAKP